MDVRESVHERMQTDLNSLHAKAGTLTVPDDPSHRSEEALMKSYHIAAVDEKNKVWLAEWTRENKDDPALNVSFFTDVVVSINSATHL